MKSNCNFITFKCGILGQVWCLIVLIPDLNRHSYFNYVVGKIIWLHTCMSVKIPIMRKCFGLISASLASFTCYSTDFFFFNLAAHFGNMIKKTSFFSLPPSVFGFSIPKYPATDLKSFSSQNVCTFLNKEFVLIFS